MEISKEEFRDFLVILEEEATKAREEFESDYVDGTVDSLLGLQEKAALLYEVLQKARMHE